MWNGRPSGANPAHTTTSGAAHAPPGVNAATETSQPGAAGLRAPRTLHDTHAVARRTRHPLGDAPSPSSRHRRSLTSRPVPVWCGPVSRGRSSVGRASRSQCEGRGFESLRLHSRWQPFELQPGRLRPKSSTNTTRRRPAGATRRRELAVPQPVEAASILHVHARVLTR